MRERESERRERDVLGLRRKVNLRHSHKYPHRRGNKQRNRKICFKNRNRSRKRKSKEQKHRKAYRFK